MERKDKAIRRLAQPTKLPDRDDPVPPAPPPEPPAIGPLTVARPWPETPAAGNLATASGSPSIESPVARTTTIGKAILLEKSDNGVHLGPYFAILIPNASTLRPSPETYCLAVIHDVLISTNKCYNIPYVVNPSVQNLLINGLEVVGYLDVGIKASGKLQLLDSRLTELRKKDLRALVLFQSIGDSGKDTIGDILDDSLRQTFGPDSHERIDKGLLSSTNQVAMKEFKDKNNEGFVFLWETFVCLPNIRLSSIYTIIFDGDWNPLVLVQVVTPEVWKRVSNYQKEVLLFACATFLCIGLGRQVHGLSRKLEAWVHDVKVIAIGNTYSKCGSWRSVSKVVNAYEVVNEKEGRNLINYNSMIVGLILKAICNYLTSKFAQQGIHVEAFKYFMKILLCWCGQMFEHSL